MNKFWRNFIKINLWIMLVLSIVGIILGIVMYYKKDVMKVSEKVSGVSKFPLKISDKIENEGSMLAD